MALTKIPRGLLDTGIADSSDATAITIDSSENVTFAGNILKTGDLTLDVSGDFIFDADGGDMRFEDGGTEWGRIQNGTGSQLILQSKISDEDMLFQGNDGGSNITALTLDMSEGGSATFNANVGIGTSPGTLLHLYNSSNAQITFQNSTTGTSIGSDGYDITLQGSDIYHILRDSGNQRFYTAGTERLRIDSAGNVGIGHTNPAVMLAPDVVIGATATNGGITIKSAATTHAAGLHFADADSGTDRYDGYIQYEHDNRALTLGTAAVERMRIDSSGIITTPQRPLFMAYGSGGWTTMSGTGNNPFILSSNMWTEEYDVKGNFTGTNGRFTAPVAGWYQFIFNSYTRANDTSGYCYPTFFKNGSQWTAGNHTNIQHYQNHADEDLGFNKVAMIYMAKDDYVQVGYYTYGSNNPISYHGGSLGFSGYLIG